MNTLINRNKKTTTFEAAFIQSATNYSTKLTFVTREEYLDWVKQWKEDFKLIDRHHKIQCLTWRLNVSRLQPKIDRLQKNIDRLIPLNESEIIRLKQIEAQYINDFKLHPWQVCSHYLFWYMLVKRKAGKIRANVQRTLRLINK